MEKEAFLEAVKQEYQEALQEHRRRLWRDLIRDGRGFPTVESELGWRIVFRGTEGARD